MWSGLPMLGTHCHSWGFWKETPAEDCCLLPQHGAHGVGVVGRLATSCAVFQNSNWRPHDTTLRGGHRAVGHAPLGRN